MPLERLIVTLKKNGTFRGASAQDYDGLPVPLTEAAITALLPTLNTAALARVVELEAAALARVVELEAAATAADAKFTAKQAETDAALSALTKILTTAQDAVLKPGEKLDVIKPLAKAATTSVRQRERVRIATELAAKQAELAALDAAGG